MSFSNYIKPSHIGGIQGITSCVRFLLIINLGIFFAEIIFSIPFIQWFALPSFWWHTLDFPKLFTYMFVHGSFNHIFINMLGLFFIGPIVERTLGSYRFFILYYLSGILGGLGWSLLSLNSNGTWCVGASGAVMGILGAFGALYPNTKLLLWFVIPVRAWVLVLILVFWELSETMNDALIGGIANAAHLIGLITGLSYILYIKYSSQIKFLLKKINYPKNRNNKVSKEPNSDKEINRILEKIGKHGMGSLTKHEKLVLERATRR
tara:strand:- start:3 stop:794 length:792 start_codon:yes stop_codon:yes gene_type:complete